MREVLAQLDRWQQQGEDVAMATLVRVRRSSPRLPGARLCVARGGRMTGSVSGGCVENDVMERALLVLASGEPVVATYGIDDETGLRVGLSCGGSIDVLIEPFAPSAAWQAVRSAVGAQEPVALATALEPAPLRGRKLAVLNDGTTAGSVDPALDAQLAAGARGFMTEGGARVVNVPWQGGEAGVFIEVFLPPERLFIVGATHTAIALCRMAKGLGFRVTVVDPRGAFATSERFPEADEISRVWPDEAFAATDLDAYAYVVALTHDPRFDIPTLARALRGGARYIGAMGSQRTHERRKAQLRGQGFGDAALARIRAPIGLDIGSRTPEEIALAILAEMIAVRYGRDGRALAEKRTASHARR